MYIEAEEADGQTAISFVRNVDSKNTVMGKSPFLVVVCVVNMMKAQLQAQHLIMLSFPNTWERFFV